MIVWTKSEDQIFFEKEALSVLKKVSKANHLQVVNYQNESFDSTVSSN